MKRLSIFYLILSVWLSFTGVAVAKPTPLFKKCYTERTAVKTVINAIKLPLLKHSANLSHSYASKKAKFKTFASKVYKKRATRLETTALPKLYLSQFIFIKQYTKRQTYGLSILYHVALHTYLHLYQLF